VSFSPPFSLHVAYLSLATSECFDTTKQKIISSPHTNTVVTPPSPHPLTLPSNASLLYNPHPSPLSHNAPTQPLGDHPLTLPKDPFL